MNVSIGGVLRALSLAMLVGVCGCAVSDPAQREQQYRDLQTLQQRHETERQSREADRIIFQ